MAINYSSPNKLEDREKNNITLQLSTLNQLQEKKIHNNSRVKY